MFLKTGEAFIKFHGIEIIGKAKFKFHEVKSVNINNSQINIDGVKKVIDVSEKTIKEVGSLIAYLRSKYAHAVIIEKGKELTQEFAENTDIILNPINGPYSWDIIDEFNGDNLSLLKLLLKQTNLDNKKKELESILLKELNSANMKNNLEKQKLLENIILKGRALSYLNPLINEYPQISLARYIQGHGNILMFIPCFETPDLIKLSNMIKSLAKEKGTYVIENMRNI